MPTDLRPPALTWQPLSEQPPISWRSDFLGKSAQGATAVLELHLIPVAALHIEVRRLSQLGDELATLGREARLFGPAQALTINGDGTCAYAISQRTREEDEAGLAVTRTGQRTTWIALPHDNMGAVFDPDDLRPRLVALLGVLGSISLPEPDQTACAMRIEPLMLTSLASAATLGHRTQSQMPLASRSACVVTPDDAVLTAALAGQVLDIAEELVARLAAELGRR